jgi:hypothetical protein
MKGWIGYALLAASLVVAFQGYGNVSNPEGTQALAKSVACDADSQCILKAEDPEEVRTDVFGRKYQWRSSVGPVHAICRRSFIFFGPWHCDAHKGAM